MVNIRNLLSSTRRLSVLAVNLAVADFLVILICLPPTLLSDVTETWYMGSVMRKVVKYFQVSGRGGFTCGQQDGMAA